MCSTPNTIGEFEVSCRHCNECVAARKNGWVARAMAEKASAGAAFIINLTYAPLPDGTDPLGARLFRYSDVQKFYKSLREAYFRQYGVRGEISYICPGEYGSDNNRVHYHLVLFTDKPLGVLGKWSDLRGKQLDTMPIEYNCHWSLWPHGMVRPQEPTEKGMSYVLKYITKAQFNVVNSKDTMRETKGLVHASGIFKMSKKIPIGKKYLISVLDRWEADLYVPVDLKVRIPDYSGYWFPQGLMREYMLDRIWEINERYKKQHGKDAPQWTALLASVSENNNKDWEGLVYGQIEETDSNKQSEEKHFANNAARRKAASKAGEIVTRCGGVLPCRECANSWDKRELDALRREYAHWFNAWVEKRNKGEKDHAEFKNWWLGRFRPSRGCYFRQEREVLDAFKARKGIARLERKLGNVSRSTR